MGTLSSAALGAMAMLGVVLLWAGFIKVDCEPRPTGRRGRLGMAWRSLHPRRQLWIAGGLAIGLLAAIVTGWIVAALLVPAVLVVIPMLLSEPPHREVALLAALDRWVRLLAPSIATGKSIRDAIIATRRQAPGELGDHVALLVARMDQGWATRSALLAMADDLDSADADAVLAALSIAASRGGSGTKATLAALSDNTQRRLSALREIATERAKPRAVVRQVTIITLVVLGLSLVMGGGYFTPYGTPIGQVIALGLASAYVGALLMLRRRTTPPAAARFLRAGVS